MNNQRIIKKYANRRLYDTQRGAYITLEDIRRLVIERIDFQVIDAQTKKDLTQNILLQIISEQENSNSPIFTTALLRDFIYLYHNNSQSLLRDYLSHAMAVFNDQNQFLHNQWQNYQKIFTHPPGFPNKEK